MEYTIILPPPKCGLYMVQALAVYRMYYKWQIKSRILEEIKDLKKLHKLKNTQLKKTRRNNNIFC